MSAEEAYSPGTSLRSTKEIPVERAFERLFRDYGLPDAIRTDNGVPFATIALGRLSRLSVWWIKLGIPLSSLNRRIPRNWTVLHLLGSFEPNQSSNAV